ncbi:MAG: alpha/beta hydrolase [Pseudomonadota bacterium]
MRSTNAHIPELDFKSSDRPLSSLMSAPLNKPATASKNSAPPSEAELVHMLYDAVIDNSLWPEMISELMEHIEVANEASPTPVQANFQGLVTHFERAMRLSENIVALQEENSTLGGVLDSLAVGLCVYDHAGHRLYANKAAHESGINRRRLVELDSSARPAISSSGTKAPSLRSVDGAKVAVVQASSIKNTRLPPNAATLVIALPDLAPQAFDDFRKSHYLSAAEAKLVRALYETRNLREAASLCDLTYESARTYLKRIYLKTGCADQSSLLSELERNPLTVVDRGGRNEIDASATRKNLLLNDGRNLEYFDIGPPNGKLVLHFDALTGVAIDALGNPQLYHKHLEALGLRIVVPCRPGTFGSHYKKMAGLSDFTGDILQLMDHLRADNATLLSQAFGSCGALAFAATAPKRVEKLVLCAPSYPRHEPADWRSMDVFYIISGVIGRRAPSLLKAIVPYLMRSVMQNTGKYLERHIARSKCPADIAVLSSPVLQRRIPEMLALRTAQGTDGLVQENFLNTHGWDFDLSAVTMPTHIIQGELDNVSDPAGSRKLQTALPNGQYHSFAELGQYLLFTDWTWILEACASSDANRVIENARIRHFKTNADDTSPRLATVS